MENWEQRKAETREKLIQLGVSGLKKLGYRRVNERNIFSNKEYAVMFGTMLCKTREELSILHLVPIMVIDEINEEIIKLHNLSSDDTQS